MAEIPPTDPKYPPYVITFSGVVLGDKNGERVTGPHTFHFVAAGGAKLKLTLSRKVANDVDKMPDLSLAVEEE